MPAKAGAPLSLHVRIFLVSGGFTMNQIRFAFFTLLVGLISISLLADSIDPNQAIQQANSLVESAKQSGQIYLQSQNDSARKDCKKKLEDAEKLVKKLVEKNRSCEECIQTLGAVYFSQAYFRISKDYDETINL